MKSVPAIAAAALICTASGLFGQGSLRWGNAAGTTSTGVRAPIYGVDPMDPFTARTGNSANGLPAGTQTYGGPLLEGTGFTAAVFFGATPEAVMANLNPLDTAAFRTGMGAGFIVGAPSVVVPGSFPGQRVHAQLRAWDNRDGTVTSWAHVMADPSIPHGSSEVILSIGLNDSDPNSTLPIVFSMPDIRSFNLVVPEPSGFGFFVVLGVFSLAFALHSKGIPR